MKTFFRRHNGDRGRTNKTLRGERLKPLLLVYSISAGTLEPLWTMSDDKMKLYFLQSHLRPQAIHYSGTKHHPKSVPCSSGIQVRVATDADRKSPTNMRGHLGFIDFISF